MNSTKCESTDLIIVGGGIFGSAIAYYFRKDNPGKEVLVFERNEICSGNTSLAAALMSQARSYGHMIPLSLETYRVIPELEKLTADIIPVRQNGAIHLATRPDQMKQLKKMLLIASQYGLDWEIITARQAMHRLPWLVVPHDALIAFLPGEAYTDPYVLGMSFANAAKATGARFIRNTGVNELIRKENKIIGVKTEGGTYYADTTVLAAGVWSTNLAYSIGLALPMAPVRSQYWITEISESLFPASSPSVLIPEASFYSRPQGNCLLFGIREESSMVADPAMLPDVMGDYIFSSDSGWRDLEAEYNRLLPFFPEFENTGIKNYVAGFSGYTPDNQFILGKAPGMDGLLLATGCVGAGISVSGGVGLGIACLAADKPNPFDFSLYSCDRFGSFDPYSAGHLERCAAARSRKTSG